jgi:predicted RNA binding protein YcfA (HicA-like mRNA interferase family)
VSRLKLINSQTMEKLLFSLGFNKKRQKGRHAFYKHYDGRTTTIPHHPGRLLARALIRKILKDIELSVEEYDKLIKDL